MARRSSRPTPEETPAETPAPEESEVSGKAFDVFNKDGAFVRTYSVEVHGKGAVKLAEEFAGKIKGTVKKH